MAYWNPLTEKELDRIPTASKQIRNMIIRNSLKCGWPVKWGHQWDIAYPDKRMVPTGLTRLSDWTLRQWQEFIIKNY